MTVSGSGARIVNFVQVLTDGGMFSIVHNGVENTAMPAFGETLEESDIWHVANFVRIFHEN